MTIKTEQYQDIVREVIARHKDELGRLMPILHDLQHQLGYIPAGTVPLLAAGLNLSRAEIQGVIGFYHDFRTSPTGQTVIQICRAEACQAMGSRSLEQHARNKLGIDFGETTTDGQFTLEPVYCLGNCACTPSIRIGDEVHARVTPEKFDALIADEMGRN
jgi:formate dehydrogenase subunit gamma